MDKIIRIATYCASAVQLVLIGFLIPDTYGDDIFLLLLLGILPVLTLIALYTGPDLEERRLMRKVHKARLENELATLSGKQTAKKK